jgi:emp24/gp25L/p24 family/GOLD
MIKPFHITLILLVITVHADDNEVLDEVIDKSLKEQQDMTPEAIMAEWETNMKNFAPSDMMTFLALKAGETVFENIQVRTEVRGAFFTKGGRAPLILTITDPNGKIKYKRGPAAEGIFHFKAMATGIYEFKLEIQSIFGLYLVTFCLHTGPGVWETYVNTKDLDPMQNKFVELGGDLSAIMSETKVATIRQESHYKITQSTHSKVFYVAIFETLAIVITIFYQLHIIKRIFDHKRLI